MSNNHPLTKQDVMQELSAMEGRLEALQTQWQSTEADIKATETTLAERKEALENIKKEVGEHRTGIANMRNLLGTYQQQELVLSGNDEDFIGCPKEWQREIIVFLRKQPGVQIHFSAMLTFVDKKMDSDVFTKNRAAMLNLMGHLISKGKVAKGKNGSYAWAVFPKDWKAPAPIIPITRNTPMDPREPIAQDMFRGILSGTGLMQRELGGFEQKFHDQCTQMAPGWDRDSNARYIEAYLYARAWSPHAAQHGFSSELILYKGSESTRQTADLSQHFITRRGQPAPVGRWEEVTTPTTRQPAIDPKRRGGPK